MLNNSLRNSFLNPKYLYPLTIIIGILIIPLIAATGIIDIITYHLTMEILALGISLGILIVTSSTWNISKNQWSKYLGLSFGVLCIFLLSHIVFYNKENIRLSYIFDLYESIIRALTISTFVQFSFKDLKARRFFRTFMLIAAILLGFIVINEIPPVFILGEKTYNSTGQPIILVLYSINLLTLYLRRKIIKQDIAIYLLISTTFALLSELMIVFNIGYDNLSIITSHYFKVLSVFIIYRLIINQILLQPVEHLNESLLKKNAELEITVQKLNLQKERLDKLKKDLSERNIDYITEANHSKAMKLELQLARDNERLCTEFFANLYHEFRTPLNVIYSSCQLIEMYTSKNSIDDVKRYNKLIKQNCFRISKLTNNIIDCNRLSEGFYVISYSKIDFVKVVEDTALSVASYLEKNNVDIIFDTDVEEKFIMADEEKIERIVLNLLSNAVKYRCEKDSLIEIKIEDRLDEIILSIKDNGIGIPKEKQSTVFNRFIKADSSLNRVGEGSGLGLYIVKSLVELHNGTIELKSEENNGTEFIIRLPVITSKQQVEEAKIIRTKTLGEKIHIEFSDIYDIYQEDNLSHK